MMMPRAALKLIKTIDTLKSPSLEQSLGLRWASSLFMTAMETDSHRVTMAVAWGRAHKQYIKRLAE